MREKLTNTAILEPNVTKLDGTYSNSFFHLNPIIKFTYSFGELERQSKVTKRRVFRFGMGNALNPFPN
jgi:hypothetical protein